MISIILAYIASLALQFINATGYAGVFILSALESCAIPIPSEVVVPFSGFLAATGQFNIVLVIILATLGNWLGSLVLYGIGKSGGRHLVEKYGKYILIRSHDLDQADDWFRRHGSSTVFWSRVLPVVRTFSSLPAGVARMNLKKFNTYTLVGSAIWNTGLAYAGYTAGEHWDSFHKYFQKFDIVIGTIIVFGIIWFIIKHLKHQHV
ncbi:MAG: hypothetical protein A3I39_00520 [Candidatus Yanofskybacteria bacterium RIFCSPLOWO2_02_FULL_47_9b]|uniref:VTT domain-containing protein n=1 Tax=Candidatus Yanofskybacteria bacterium RIFCSPLOWO2_02_FULL_47_9b TaxID=1802708 RepID=A0A1F8H7H4_9BACT|nr:MAG: hypothetical protein A3I39_00520 [Candidatus Yanofskybacteria bacterium RIFCSPLOWO2_02_FULL_47_9b]